LQVVAVQVSHPLHRTSPLDAGEEGEEERRRAGSGRVGSLMPIWLTLNLAIQDNCKRSS
jgi:hypothetical protein